MAYEEPLLRSGAYASSVFVVDQDVFWQQDEPAVRHDGDDTISLQLPFSELMNDGPQPRLVQDVEEVLFGQSE